MTQPSPGTAPEPVATPSAGPEEPPLSAVRNFRDVGGLPTRDGRRTRRGVLFRSGHLAHATETDAAYLAGLGLHSVFDFRNAADRALEGPDVELPGVRNVHLPLNDPADGAEFWRIVRDGEVGQLRAALGEGRAEARMEASYRQLIKERTAEHGRLLRAIAEDSVPALLHCAAGKDRAGTSIALVLLAVGVEEEAIEEDYLKSDARHRRYRVSRGKDAVAPTAPEVAELLDPLFAARASYLRAAFETIDTHWGGRERYFGEVLGMDGALRERLRERLVE
ncbi:tyrosine-protein phosphatase [Streptomyces sp. DSM 41982]|uniref:Tyrosine-protein phosphatase n=1 Tax=Streptomyces evansiae TaxID=3075535 RepID=A0ABD5E268_9ACTN|nr:MULTISPECIES: tyrosine-protein phosphatase [unclassified Streptomyces]MDT0414763.1 tyrosine-protein phosphatase [Streptomyces sp. DSM 41982]SCD68822.1 protein-tyrosine phosphatase [Streptomyces sp. SolWspMP-sol7th]